MVHTYLSSVDMTKRFDIIVLADDSRTSELLDSMQDEELPTIDGDALFSLLFSFVNDILHEVIDIEGISKWVLYNVASVDEESRKISENEKMIMLRELTIEFLKTWINKLKEEGIIQNEYFAYDYAGLLRDGSFVFRRKEDAV